MVNHFIFDVGVSLECRNSNLYELLPLPFVKRTKQSASSSVGFQKY